MKKLIIAFLLFADSTNAQTYKPITTKDSIKMFNWISCNWKYKDVSIKINPAYAIIENDTFYNPIYKVLTVDEYFVENDYGIIKKKNRPAYLILVSSDKVPVSIVNNNPFYKLRTAFLVLNNVIYYDKNGEVYKLHKTN